MESTNPVLSDKTFSGVRAYSGPSMTLDGVTFKSGVLLLLAVLSAAFSWSAVSANPAVALPLVAVGGLGGFIIAMVLMFKQQWAPGLAPAYAVLEGFLLGAISFVFSAKYQFIAFQAAGLTNAANGGRMGIETLLRHPPDLLILPDTPTFPSLATEMLRAPVLASIPRRYLPPALTLCAGPWSARAVAMLAR